MLLTFRRLILLAVCLSSGVAAAAAIAGLTGWAIAALSAALLAGFSWILLWTRRMNAEMAELRRSSTAAADDVASLRGGLDDVHQGQQQTSKDLAWIRQQLTNDGRVTVNMRKLNERVTEHGQHTSEQMRGGFAQLRRDIERLSVAMQGLPGTTVELGRRYRQLVQHDRLMPAASGWALTPGTLVWLLDHLASGDVSRVLECGSGTSTVWFAASFEERGEGRVFALESDPAFAEQTRSHLEKVGLSHRAEVIDAPLVDTAANGRDPRPWYDLSRLPNAARDIDLLFVDGPAGALAPEVRYPAFPLLAERLADHAVIVLDDTIRPDEAKIVEAWLGEEHAGRRLERIATTDRSTALRIV